MIISTDCDTGIKTEYVGEVRMYYILIYGFLPGLIGACFIVAGELYLAGIVIGVFLFVTCLFIFKWIGDALKIYSMPEKKRRKKK